MRRMLRGTALVPAGTGSAGSRRTAAGVGTKLPPFLSRAGTSGMRTGFLAARGIGHHDLLPDDPGRLSQRNFGTEQTPISTTSPADKASGTARYVSTAGPLLRQNGPLIAVLDQNQRWTPIPIHSTFCVNSCPSGLGPEKYSAKTWSFLSPTRAFSNCNPPIIDWATFQFVRALA